MDNKFIGLMVGLTVGVLMVSGFLWPIVSDATATETTFTNEGYFRLAEIDATGSHEINWTYEKPNVVTVDGQDVTINYAVPNGQITVIADSNWIARMFLDGTGTVSSFAVVGASGGTAGASVADSATASIELNEGAMTATIGSTSRNGTYTQAWIPSNTGAFVMKAPDEIAKINGDSKIVAYGLTRVRTASGAISGPPGFGISMIGTYNDGVETAIWRGTEMTLSNPIIHATRNNAYEDIFELDKVTATGTYSEVVDEQTVTTESEIVYNQIIVPYQVTSEKSWHLDTTQIALVAAIGTLGAIVLIAAAAGSIRRLD